MEITHQLLKNLDQSLLNQEKFLDISGKQIGEHEGIINYTIGQRKGIKIAQYIILFM